MSDQATRQIDIFQLQDFFRLLWAKRKILLIAIVAALAIAAVYIVTSKKVYQVRSNVREAIPVHSLIIGAPPYLSLAPNLPTRFFETAFSEEFRREFFDSHRLFTEFTGKDSASASPQEVDKVFLAQFNSRLRIDTTQEKPIRAFALSFTGSDPVKGANWLNQFIDEANLRAAALEFEDVRKRIKVLREDLTQRIEAQTEAARESEKMRAQYQLARLKTARQIAKKMGVSNPVSAYASSVDDWGKPLAYFRGEKALEAEISVLSSQKDFPPEPSSMELMGEYQELSAIKVLDAGVKAVDVLSRASAAVNQAKPSAILILSLALFAGLFLASLGVLISQFFVAASEPALAYRPA
jgi:LPS O-antigen subunit length determinant protein (WzzB/FepE family)